MAHWFNTDEDEDKLKVKNRVLDEIFLAQHSESSRHSIVLNWYNPFPPLIRPAQNARWRTWRGIQQCEVIDNNEFNSFSTEETVPWRKMNVYYEAKFAPKSEDEEEEETLV